jgi:cyclic dehypoxanthinyl futalosine synthase
VTLIGEILERASAGERLSTAEAERLFDCDDLPQLGAAAHRVRLRKAPPGIATYVVDRNINYTNVCICGCRFCAFHRDEGAPDAYVLSYEAIGDKVAEMLELGGRQILLQGGLHPSLRLEWYEGLLRFLKTRYGIHNHAFSAPEIVHFAKIEGLPIETVLARLKGAGLDSIPGGGAEILTDRVRGAVSPKKCSVDEWFAVHRAAHRLGMRTTATMVLGHVETIADRIEHFDRVRRLQDETGGFTAFISWTFQPGNTALAEDLNATPHSAFRLGSHDYLKTLAISRLFIDNIDNFQASWVTQGDAIGQVALMFGCNDLGSTMIEENVVRSAGVCFRVSEERLRYLITEAGFNPVKRDFFYKPLEELA